MPCYADNQLSSVDEMWTVKKPEMNSRRTLRAPGRASKNAFTVGNGHHPGVTPGRGMRRETRRFARMSGPGGRSAGPDGRSAGQAGPGPGEVSSTSYVEGTFVVSAQSPGSADRLGIQWSPRFSNFRLNSAYAARSAWSPSP